jgi:translation initiation factor 2 subunit 1
MMKGESYPEKGELIIGTVNNIFNQGAFIDLDEYPGRQGMLHITEISLKWVRNIRDYVKEGQKVVLIVLRTDASRGHIDLSLRRVNDSQRKGKLQTVKQKQRAHKLVEIFAGEVAQDMEKVLKTLNTAFEDYETLYLGLEEMAGDHSIADGLKIQDKWKKPLLDLVEKSIKPPVVDITGYVELQSYEPDGVETVKKALKEIKKHKPRNCQLRLTYVSAPIYRINASSGDYKSAEKAMKKAVEQGIRFIESRKGVGVFHRELNLK